VYVHVYSIRTRVRQSTTHSNPCFPLVLLPQRVRPQSLPIQGRAMADGQCVQLLSATATAPAPQCLRGERWPNARSRPIKTITNSRQCPSPQTRAMPCTASAVMRRLDSIRDSLARTLDRGLFKDVRAIVLRRAIKHQVAPRGS
jgi:hypothetical protein